ncbi:MAG: carboxypeptidase-like regulatory domain-containing protein [Flavobacteriaceae bacterium]|jgi:hypothetical protein|nr:carboxypeptidase-like regulatory domain-containing protein [Flavobacteriaceae bacterium]
MTNKYKITIPEPCSEDWNLMTPQEKGRHCAVCDKVVVDFSNATRQEIVDHIGNDAEVCGRIPLRFLEEQSEREKTKKSFGLNGLVATVVNLLALTTTVSYVAAKEVKPVVVIEKSDTPEQVGIGLVMTKDSIKGIVKSEDEKFGLSRTLVQLKETDHCTVTDAKGQFSLGFYNGRLKVGSKLVFTKAYYEPLEIEIKDLDKPIEVVLERKYKNKMVTGKPVLESIIDCKGNEI